MKKFILLFILIVLTVFICEVSPLISNAKQFKPAATDINNPSVLKSKDSKKQSVKPNIKKSSLKVGLPELVITGLYLDSKCNITGYFQNKGGKIALTHPDFKKIEIKVGFTRNKKTKKAMLSTQKGSKSTQPRLLSMTTDKRNFILGKAVKFTSNLKVTGPGGAKVWAQIDPGNKIKETRKGEQQKDIKKQLNSKCKLRAPERASIVKKPVIKTDSDTKKKVGTESPSTIKSNKMVTKGGGSLFTGIRFVSPTPFQVITRAQGSIPVIYEYLSSPDEVAEITYNLLAFNERGEFIKYITNQYWQMHEYLTPEGASFSISLSQIPESDLFYYQYRVKVSGHSQTGITAEGISEPFVIDYRREIPSDDGEGGVYVDPAPVSNGLQIIEPAAMVEGYYHDQEFNIRYIINSVNIPADAIIEFTLKEAYPPYGRVHQIRTQINSDGRTMMSTNGAHGIMCRITGVIKDADENILASGSSSIFRIEVRGWNVIGGLKITSPTIDDWYRVPDQIVVSYDIGSCEEALTSGILIWLHHKTGAIVPVSYLLFRGIITERFDTMSFNLPSGALADDPTGRSTSWFITIQPNRRGDIPSGCYAGSDAFRISF